MIKITCFLAIVVAIAFFSSTIVNQASPLSNKSVVERSFQQWQNGTGSPFDLNRLFFVNWQTTSD